MLRRIRSVLPGWFAASLGKRRQIEPSVHLRHHRKRNDARLFRKDTAMRARSIFVLAFTFTMPSLMQAQVTHGQKPKLPAPFATKSAGNGPDSAKPPAGFLPTMADGGAEWGYFSGRYGSEGNCRDARSAACRRGARARSFCGRHEAAVRHCVSRKLRLR